MSKIDYKVVTKKILTPRKTKPFQLSLPALFSVHDVTAMTGLAGETIRRWCRERQVEHFTLGGQYRFSDSQAQQFFVKVPASKNKTTRRPLARRA